MRKRRVYMVRVLQSNLNVLIEDRQAIPEQRLWKAVLAQMLYDALSDFENKFINKDEKKAAEFWLTHKTKDFVDVCTHAGFDPDYILGKSKKLVNLKKLKQLGIIWNHERKTKYEGDMSGMQG
jgi:hypothetical protein